MQNVNTASDSGSRSPVLQEIFPAAAKRYSGEDLLARACSILGHYVGFPEQAELY
jgi:hypothetical protein